MRLALPADLDPVQVRRLLPRESEMGELLEPQIWAGERPEDPDRRRRPIDHEWPFAADDGARENDV